MMGPSEKQIDFATAIAEMVGDDLPVDFTADAYSDFISGHIDEFHKLQNEFRYGSESCISFHHSYCLSDGFNGDEKLNINPKKG